MAICTCVVQPEQIAPGIVAEPEEGLDAFSKSKFGWGADIRRLETAPGSDYTAHAPLTSSILPFTPTKGVDQIERIAMLEELPGMWSQKVGCRLDKVVGAIPDPSLP